MGAVVICVVIIISALVVLATFPRKGGQRAPTREELAAATPVADDTGRLSCKNCGTPFDTLTLDGARQWCAVIVRRDAPLSVVCRKCDTGSVFLKSDFDSAPGLVAT